MLTDQQKLFCREYVKDFRIVAAMRRAGYSESSADKSAYRMLKNPDVAFFVKQLMDKQNEKQELTAERVLEELKRLALSDIRAYYKWSEKKKKYVLKALDELTLEQSAAIARYEPGKGYTLYNKDGALDKLAKYFKLYSEIDQTITNFVLMGQMTIGGKPKHFKIGKPAPQRMKKD